MSKNIFCKAALSALLVLGLGPAAVAQTNSQSTSSPGQSSPNSAQTSGAQSSSATNSQSDGRFRVGTRGVSEQAEQRLIKEVRHELVMLPYYNLFDNLEFQVNGNNVTLLGKVTDSSTKSDAEKSVRRIEGVENVQNNIEVLPPSPNDDRIREQVYRAIYGYGALFKYAHGAVPPIHIVVDRGRVSLEGVVDNEADKNLAYIRANGVSGVFQVTNNLRVVNDNKKG